jgi:hypothetical protein
MISNTYRVFSIMLVTVLVVCASSWAQRGYVTSQATVPFSFYVGTEEFPAGDYVLDSSSPGFLRIHSQDGKISRQISVNPYGEPVKRTEARLVFVKRGNRYVLRELWGVLGKYVMTTEYGKQNTKDEETREIRLTFPG